jgi:nicotinamide-nucleotide amidase
MRAEIIAVGTEVLMGEVINTNAAWISQQLADWGIDVYYHVTVGDNPARIQGVVRQALERSDLLIFTGGLGPTDDDLTVQTLADTFGVGLISDPESEQRIREYLTRLGRTVAASNMKQALKPADAHTLSNDMGTAPGIAWDVSAYAQKPALILCFPGVPRELKWLWPFAQLFIRQLQAQLGETPTVLATHFMRFFGIGESVLAEQLQDLMAAASPTVAPYVGQGEVRLRLAAKATTRAEAEAQITPVRDEILRRCGQYYFGEGDQSLEEAVAQLLVAQGKTVAVAESCTGGLVSSRLTDVPGSSAYTWLNMVTYSNAQKQAMLGVSPDDLTQHGAVSPQVAAQMAQGIRRVSGCDVGLSLTGIAGPDGGTDDKPVGLVWIGLDAANLSSPQVARFLVNPRYSRQDIKTWFSQYALNILRLHLKAALSS